MRKILIALYCLTQAIGVACLLLSEPFGSAVMWGTSYVLLFPGNELGGSLVEKLFWNRGNVTLGQIGAMEIVAAVMINAVPWLALYAALRLVQRVRGRRPSSR